VLFNDISAKLPSCFLNLLLKSSFVCISELQDVSCWGCNANSTQTLARSMLLYLSNTFCRYTRSVQLAKNEAHCLGPVSNLYWINDLKRFQTVFFPWKNPIVRPTKIATFWPTKGNHFCVTPNDCRRQTLVFKQVKTFLAPPSLTAPPQTPNLDPPLFMTPAISSIYMKKTLPDVLLFFVL